MLNGVATQGIDPDLTPCGYGLLLAEAIALPGNAGITFQGPVKVGPFEIPGPTARAWLLEPNPHSKPNSDVLRPWANGQDLAKRPSDTWIVDFGVDMPRSEAALYEAPYSQAATHVRPMREAGRRGGGSGIGGATGKLSRRCGGGYRASAGTSQRREWQSIGSSPGCRPEFSPIPVSTPSAARTTRPSGFFRPGRIWSGLWPTLQGTATARMAEGRPTTPEPASRPSPSPTV